MTIFNPLERIQTEKIKKIISKLHQNFSNAQNINIDIEELQKNILAEKTMLETSLESTKYSMKILQKKHTTEGVSNVYVFDYKDYDIVETTDNANIDTRLKYITSAIKTKTIFSNIKITIDANSNGFPGNTHEIERYQDKVLFKGQNSPYINLKNMLEDQGVFEYEIFRISDSVKELTQGMGFHYKEGKTYLSKTNELVLKLKLEFPSVRSINMFSISPYILNCIGYSYCNITEISIYDKENNKYNIINSQNSVQFKHTLTYVFPSVECSYIILEIKQFNGYETHIGHYYEEFNGIRFNTEKDSLKLLGFGYNENNNELIQPNTDIQNITSKNLYSIFNKNYPIEIIEAERFVIGISDIQICYCTFKPTSSLISKPIFVNGLNNFRITTNQNDYTIKYFVSFNSMGWINIERDKIYKTIDLVDIDNIYSISYKIEFNVFDNNIPILYDFFLETEVKEW